MRVDFHKPAHILFFAGLLPVLSVLMSWVFFSLVGSTPFWAETISPLVAYGLLYSLFDKFAWRWKIFTSLGITCFPDLRGRWKGTLRSSYKENGANVEIPCYLEILQTFSTIFIRSYYERSESESAVANFMDTNGQNYLFYTYDNEPNSLKSGTMETHKGTVKLKCVKPERKLIGSYFNSIGNHGEVTFEFERENLLWRFKE